MPHKWKVENWRSAPEGLFDLTGRVAIVTGAASGLGRAIALGIDAFGANCVISDINPDGLEAVASELKNKSLSIESDTTQENGIRNVIDATLGAYGKIDISFHIPGINVRKPITELSVDEWKRIMDVNVNGIFLCGREVGKVMLEQQSGCIINMASARGVWGGVSQSAYSTSKAGVIHLTRCMALEFAPHVRVNALAPGYVTTPLVEGIMKDERWTEDMLGMHAMQRFGDPEEVVGPAVFLASNAASFVTGTTLVVDGGWTAGML